LRMELVRGERREGRLAGRRKLAAYNMRDLGWRGLAAGVRRWTIAAARGTVVYGDLRCVSRAGGHSLW
jgi:hypothetical protein